MSKTVGAGLHAHYALGSTTLAHLVKLTRADGVVLAVTLDHDLPLTFETVVYQPAFGMTPSTIVTSSALNVDNLDAKGALMALGINEADIDAGLWDLCDVRVMRVNWADLGMGAEKLKRGNFGEISIGRGTFTNEVRGITQRLAMTFGNVVSPSCNADLFDARCGVVDTAGLWKFSTTVTAIGGRGQFTASALTQAGGTTVNVTGEAVTFKNGSTTYLKHQDVSGVVISPAMTSGLDYTRVDQAGAILILSGSPVVLPGVPVAGNVSYSYATGGFFEAGKVLWTSGLNAGLAKEVKTFTAGGNVTLQEPMPYAIAPGDAFTIWTGCLKRAAEDCAAKFNNIVRFRGFNKLPGQDQMFKGAG